MVSTGERRKAAFLTEYRALCERYGMMVIRVENPGDYWAFAVGIPDTITLDAAIQEMMLEPSRTISTE